MKLFLDANVLFSASHAGSNMHRFFNLLQTQHALVSSPYAFAEAERNIILKRSPWLVCFRQMMEGIALVEEAPLRLDVVLADKDRPILGSAIAAHCDFLLTGDKRDFGHLYGKTIENVMIVNYTMLAKIILDASD